MLISFLRVIKFSFQDIFRNIWLSLVTIIIIILALFSINMLISVDLISKAAVNSVKDKIDVNLYMKSTAEENQITALKARVSGLPQVKEVVYISKNEALESFQQKHQSNPEMIDALKELGNNPLTPILVIKPKNIDKYEDLIAGLNGIDSEIIESKNFDDHKTILSKINGISSRVNEAGIFLSSIFIFITVLVVYNAIRVAIYTHKREITIMRLVGASGWFIRAPYLVSSVFYALFGVIAIILIFYPFLSLLQPYLETFFIDYQVYLISYFNQNFVRIFGLQLLAIAFVNMVASIIAVRKYSKA